jgi:hypothetical protein
MVRNNMTRLLLLTFAILAASVLTGCKGEVAGSPSYEESFNVSMADYATNHFFVDTSYVPLYGQYFRNDPPVKNPGMQVVEAEVWVEVPAATHDSTDILAIANMNLPPRSPAGYGSTYRVAPQSSDWTVREGWFRRLSVASYSFTAGGFLGMLSFDSTIAPEYTIAIAYQRADGKQFGDFLNGGYEDSTGFPIVLKMVRPPNLLPSETEGWRMMIKSIYSLGHGQVSQYGFDLNIFLDLPDGKSVTSIQGQPLLSVLGLDEDGTGVQVGQFDFRPGITIDQATGEIIFPNLEPLYQGMQSYFSAHGLEVPDSLLYAALYDTTQMAAKYSFIQNHNYVIRGKAIFN